MFQEIPNVLLASLVLMLVGSGSAAAQGVLTFGGSFVSVSRDGSHPKRLDSTGVGVEVGCSVPLTTFIVVSGGLGRDSLGFTTTRDTLDVLAPRLSFGLAIPGLYFNGEQSEAILHFGANVGHEWLLADGLVTGSSYVEPHARVMFLETGGHAWGIHVAWRVFELGGSYARRALVGAAWEF